MFISFSFVTSVPWKFGQIVERYSIDESDADDTCLVMELRRKFGGQLKNFPGVNRIEQKGSKTFYNSFCFEFF